MSEKSMAENEIIRVIQELSLNDKISVIDEKSSLEIIGDIFYSFVDISKHGKVSLNRIYQKLDSKLDNKFKKEVSFGELSWEEFLNNIYSFVSKKDIPVYLIISGTDDEDYSIISKGTLVDIYKLLFDGIPFGNNSDFTIVSTTYDWLVYYNDTDEKLCYISESE